MKYFYNFIIFFIYCVATFINKVDGAISNEIDTSLTANSELDLTNQVMETVPELAVAATSRWFDPRTLFVAELSALKAVALLSFPLLVPLLFAAGAVLLLPLQLFSLSTPLSVIGKRVHQQQQHELLENNIFRTRPIIRRVPTTRQPMATFPGLS